MFGKALCSANFLMTGTLASKTNWPSAGNLIGITAGTVDSAHRFEAQASYFHADVKVILAVVEAV